MNRATSRGSPRIEKRVAEIPGLALAGNAYHGIGVPDCIRSGAEAANAVVQLTSERQPAPHR